MNEWLSLLGIASALAVGAVSPGPSFVVVARTAVSAGRAQGVATAFGIALAGAIFATVALLGLHSVLLAVPKLFIGLKLFGGAYLLYLGARIIRGATQPLTVDASNSANASRKSSTPKPPLSTPAYSRRFYPRTRAGCSIWRPSAWSL